MFEKSGKKIKAVAEAWFWLGTILSVIAAFICLFESITEDLPIFILYGLFLLIGGPFFTWVSTLFLYGFGELIDSNQKLSESIEDELAPAVKDLSLTVSKISAKLDPLKSSSPKQCPPVQDEEDDQFIGSFVVDTSVADSFDR